MKPSIEIADGQVIATPKLLLDFLAVVSWNKVLVSIETISVGDKGISGGDQLYLWVGLTAHLLECNPPPKIKKILIDTLQSLNPNFMYQSKIERG